MHIRQANVFVKPNEQSEFTCTLSWRENEGAANVFVKPNEQSQFTCTLPWRENEGAANHH